MEMMVGIGSTCSIPGDVAGNLAQIEGLCARAAANNCKILLTPELSASGYGGYPEVLATAEPAGKGPIYQALAHFAAQYNLCVTAGFAETPAPEETTHFQAGRVFLSHYLVRPNGSYIAQRKNRVTPREAPLAPAVPLYFDDTEEIGHVPSGMHQLQFFDVEGFRCAIIICADNGIRGLDSILADAGVNLVLLPVGAGGARSAKMTQDEIQAPGGVERYLKLCNNEYFFPSGGLGDCLLHQRNLAVVNMCGYDGKQLYHGGSGSVLSKYGLIEGFLPGIENLSRQKPAFACGMVYT